MKKCFNCAEKPIHEEKTELCINCFERFYFKCEKCKKPCNREDYSASAVLCSDCNSKKNKCFLCFEEKN